MPSRQGGPGRRWHCCLQTLPPAPPYAASATLSLRQAPQTGALNLNAAPVDVNTVIEIKRGARRGPKPTGPAPPACGLIPRSGRQTPPIKPVLYNRLPTPYDRGAQKRKGAGSWVSPHLHCRYLPPATHTPRPGVQQACISCRGRLMRFKVHPCSLAAAPQCCTTLQTAADSRRCHVSATWRRSRRSQAGAVHTSIRSHGLLGFNRHASDRSQARRSPCDGWQRVAASGKPREQVRFVARMVVGGHMKLRSAHTDSNALPTGGAPAHHSPCA